MVPGDIIFWKAGNYVPADCRLVESVNVKTQEAALTGESGRKRMTTLQCINAEARERERFTNLGLGPLLTLADSDLLVFAEGAVDACIADDGYLFAPVAISLPDNRADRK